ncbi:hypothetical protein [Streptococcus suis]|uniref:hypothetical protein n=3 Tax=Streptococcus suis TaxID=1307 RepID=UPI0006B6430A|nr:hypothetical protein [Streptococcus suis]AZR96384.1 hypothetical protein A7J10_00330 [Streptococcus suis]KPA66740.1 hypothetical protein XK27_07485 [Streptococcus suis]MCK4024436.1 hypothetical protein [Streptococcus suis]MCQ9277585.1 hypothetical protein [Streptococcus suis]HEM3602580.1 hypothetical protein [Streptococcus suis]
MKLDIVFKRITKIEYSLNTGLESIDGREDVVTNNNFTYVPIINDDRILVTVQSLVKSSISEKEFRTLEFEVDVLLSLKDFNFEEYDSDEEKVIEEVHTQFEIINDVIVENIRKSITSLDDLSSL